MAAAAAAMRCIVTPLVLPVLPVTIGLLTDKRIAVGFQYFLTGTLLIARTAHSLVHINVGATVVAVSVTLILATGTGLGSIPFPMIGGATVLVSIVATCLVQMDVLTVTRIDTAHWLNRGCRGNKFQVTRAIQMTDLEYTYELYFVLWP